MKSKFLITILMFGFLLRIMAMSKVPVGFTWDEAALGYNAYSLLQTAKDEHGKFIPLIFKSFGDYKPGLYIYFTVLPVRLFGLSEFSTRLPSVILGSLSIALIYLLTRKIFNQSVAIAAAFLFSINPAMISFSRAAWESNLNLFLLLLIANLFLNSKYYLVSLFSAMTFYAYQGAKLNTPFLLLFLYFFFKPKLKEILKPLFFLILFVLPVLLVLPATSGRLKVFSVFSYARNPEYVKNLISQDPPRLQNAFKILFHSEIYNQLRGISQRFLNHLSPRFLFIEGNWTDRRQTPAVYYGNFHLFEFITIAFGVYILAKKNLNLLIAICLLVVGIIIPSALSRDIITTVRSLPIIVPLTILSAIGFSKILKTKYLNFGFWILCFLSLVYFLDLYFRHTPYFFAKDWLYPYQPAINFVSKYQPEYSQIYFTDKLGQPYIFYLFYTSYSPALYQKQNVFVDNPSGDVGQVKRLDNINFGEIYWPALRSQSGILVVGDEYELPEKDLNQPELIRYGDIKYPDGQLGFRVIGIPKQYAQK